MRSANVLIVGMRGLGMEVCRFLVLAGIGVVTIIDGKKVTEEDLGAGYYFEAEDIGLNRAEAAADNVRKLNPRVVVTAEDGSINEKSDEYFGQFDLVCLTECDLPTMVNLIGLADCVLLLANFHHVQNATAVAPPVQKRVNNACRMRNKKFYAACTYGIFGYIFCDLIHHEYIDERKDSSKSGDQEVQRVMRSVDFISLEEALKKKDWSQMPFKQMKKVSPVLFAVLVLGRFYEKQGRLPCGDESDLQQLKLLREELPNDLGVRPSVLPNVILEAFNQMARTDFAAPCSIIGGMLGQSIINTLQCQEEPINNFWLYDGKEVSGVIHRIEPGRMAT